jgi:hypothetical protein
MTTLLYQKDFSTGPYHITKSGSYKLAQDIVVDFQVATKGPSKYNPLVKKCPHAFDTSSVQKIAESQTKCPGQSPNLRLGWTASVVIACDGDVDFDLNGHSIVMSSRFYIAQRFYSHFQLNISPFRTGRGPIPGTSEPFQDFNHFPTNIKIHSSKPNGIIGLTSHMGVMVNNVDKIELENVNFIDNEVAPMIANNCSNIRVNNCVWDNKNLVLPVNSSMSNLVQLTNRLQSLSSVLISGTKPETPTEIRTYLKQTNLDQRLKELLETELMAKEYLISVNTDLAKNNFKDLTNLYNAEMYNPNKTPDGSALYGLSLVNNKGNNPGIGPITSNSSGITSEPNVFVNKFTVKNIKLSCLEIPAITYNNQISDTTNPYDSVGTLKLFSGEVVFFHNLRLNQTPWFDLVIKTMQTMINIKTYEQRNNTTVKISENKKLLGTYNVFDQEIVNELKIAKTKIRQRMGTENVFPQTVEKAAYDIKDQYKILEESRLVGSKARYSVLWNQDLMQHKVKGIFLLRFEGVHNFVINKLVGDEVGSYGVNVNENDKEAVSFFGNTTDYKYMGCDVYGIALAHCSYGIVDDVNITNVDYTKPYTPECLMLKDDTGIYYSSSSTINAQAEKSNIDIKSNLLESRENENNFKTLDTKKALMNFFMRN